MKPHTSDSLDQKSDRGDSTLPLAAYPEITRFEEMASLISILSKTARAGSWHHVPHPLNAATTMFLPLWHRLEQLHGPVVSPFNM
jgi:hypothetical protein